MDFIKEILEYALNGINSETGTLVIVFSPIIGTLLLFVRYGIPKIKKYLAELKGSISGLREELSSINNNVSELKGRFDIHEAVNTEWKKNVEEDIDELKDGGGPKLMT